VDSETEIDADIQVGDQVKVEGRILADGTWLAEEISLLDDEEELRFEFVGEVSSLDPWIVGGVTLATDENTEVEGDIAVGDTVKVEGRILEDGTWLAEEIKLLKLNLGCTDKFVVVRTVETGQIVLLNWEKVEVDGAVEVEGDVKVASVVIVQVCIYEDGSTVVISIIVIYQLDELPVVIIQQPGNGSGDDGHHHDDDDDDDDDDD
jgi:hypothetical protein